MGTDPELTRGVTFRSSHQQISIVAVNMELSESPPFVVEVFSGHRQLNAMFEAKSHKLKSLRKEPDKAKITLLSFFHPARDRILLRTSASVRVFRKR